MSENKHLAPVWIAYVDGKRLDVEHEGALQKICIKDRLNGISTFSMLFDSSAVKLRDKGLLSLESQISIHLGYKDDVDEVFSGEILGFRAVLQEYGSEQLEVFGCNALHRMNHGSHYRTFEKKKPSEIIKGLADSYSLKVKGDEFGTANPVSSGQGTTDYEYLMSIAATYGKDVYAYGDTVYVSDEISVHTDEIIFEWGKSLISFEATQDLRGLYSEVACIGWDPHKSASFTGNAGISDVGKKVGGDNDWTKGSKGGNGKWTHSEIDHSAKDSKDAELIAGGTLVRNSFQYSTARGRGEGNYKLLPGMRVNIKMAGESFSGEYIADTVTHQFDNRTGYLTDFTLKRNMLPC